MAIRARPAARTIEPAAMLIASIAPAPRDIPSPGRCRRIPARPIRQFRCRSGGESTGELALIACRILRSLLSRRGPPGPAVATHGRTSKADRARRLGDDTPSRVRGLRPRPGRTDRGAARAGACSAIGCLSPSDLAYVQRSFAAPGRVPGSRLRAGESPADRPDAPVRALDRVQPRDAPQRPAAALERARSAAAPRTSPTARAPSSTRS